MSAKNIKTGSVYTGRNAKVLGNRGSWATYNQWLETGRRVKKGEHGKRVMGIASNGQPFWYTLFSKSQTGVEK